MFYTMIKLNDAMKIGKFSNCKVLTGQNNLAKDIKNITIIENPEVVNWIGEKELLITSLYAVKDDSRAQKKLISDIQNKGATALAIKCGSHLKKIPKDILDQAEKNNFPIISIPNDITYLELVNPLMNFIFNNKLLLQEDVNVATVKLDKMLVDDNPIDLLLSELEKILKKEILFECDLLDNGDYVQENAIVPLSDKQIKTLNINKYTTAIEREINGNKNIFLVTPIFIEGVMIGNLTAYQISEELDTFQRAILQKAASILGIKILKVKLHKDIKQQYENDYIRTLLYSDETLANSSLNWGNYKVNQNTSFQVINIEYLKSATDFEYKMKSKIKELFNNVLLNFSESNILVILFFNSEIPEEKLENIYEKILIYAKLYTEFTKVGVGNIEKGIHGLRKSYKQSKKSLFLSIENEVLHYNKLGPYLIMDFLMDNYDIIEEFENIINSLEKSNKDLINTLVAYFDHNEIMIKTSQSLHIHINTLKYRLKRIEEISDYSFQNTDEKYYLYLTSIFYRFKNKQQ